MQGCVKLLGEINYLAVFVSIVWAAMLGSIWYSPKVFFNVWAKELGLKMDNADRKQMVRVMGTMLVTTAVEMYSLAAVIAMLGGGIVKALHAGVLISIGMMAATRLSEANFEQRTLKTWLIQSGFNTISILGASVIMGLWK